MRNAVLSVLLSIGMVVASDTSADLCKIPSNLPPIAGDDTYHWSTPGVAVNIPVLNNDRDPENGTLTVVAVGSAGAGGQTSQAPGGGSVTFVPAAGQTSARFTYTVADPQGLTSQAVVYVGTAQVEPTVTVTWNCAYRTCSFVPAPNPTSGIVAYEWLIHRADATSLPPAKRWTGVKYVHVFDEVGPNHVVQVRVLYASGRVGIYRNDTFALTPETARIDFALLPESAAFQGLNRQIKITEANYLFKDAVYTWNWGDGSPTQSWGGNEGYLHYKHPTDPEYFWTHSYANPGAYDVTLTVTPAGSNVQPSRSTHAIIVENKPPVPSLSWHVYSDLRVDFSPTASTDDYDLTASDKRYQVTFADGRVFTTTSTDQFGGAFFGGYMYGGTHAVTLQVTDHHGLSATKHYEVVVPNTPPVASFRFDCSEGLRCKLDARDTADRDRNVKEYRWKTYEKEWTTTEPVSEMTYVIYGRHPIEVTVVDEAGAESKASRIMHVRPPHQGQRLAFYSVPPCRVYDSQTAGTPLQNGITRHVPVTGQCGIPAGAVVAEASIAVDHPSGAGHLKAVAGGGVVSESTILNFIPGAAFSNNASIMLGNGGIDILAYISGAAPATARVIVDVAGFWAPASVVATGATRGPLYLYTENCQQGQNEQYGQSGTVYGQTGVVYQVPTAPCGISSADWPVHAALVQSEVTSPEANGHVTAFGFTEGLPPVATYNIPTAFKPMTGLAIIRASTNGIYEGLSWQYVASAPNKGVFTTWRILGAFLPAGVPVPPLYPFLPERMEYVPIESCRVFDSRLPQEYGTGAPLSRPSVLIGGNCGIRRNVAGVRLNVTVLNGTTPYGFLSFPPHGNKVWGAYGSVTAHGTVVRVINDDPGYGNLPSALSINRQTENGQPSSLDYIIDVTGYFLEKNRP
jgi:Bacterial Ig domain